MACQNEINLSASSQSQEDKNQPVCASKYCLQEQSLFSVPSKHSTFVGNQGSKQTIEFLYPPFAMELLHLIQKNFVGWRDGPVCKVLIIMQAWGPEFRFPSPI